MIYLNILVMLLALVANTSAQTNQTFIFTNATGTAVTAEVWSITKDGVLYKQTNGIGRATFDRIKKEDRSQFRKQIPIKDYSMIFTNSDGNFFWENISVDQTNRFGILSLTIKRKTAWDGQQWYQLSGTVDKSSLKASRAKICIKSDSGVLELENLTSLEDYSIFEGTYFEAVIPNDKLNFFGNSGIVVCIAGNGVNAEWAVPDSDLSLPAFVDYTAKTKAIIPNGVSIGFKMPDRVMQKKIPGK